MKKSMFAIAVGAAFAMPGAAFADGPTVYGRFNIGLDGQKDEIGLDSKSADETTWRLQDQNDSSRLGVKGKNEVGIADLNVIYQLEYGVNPDGSESNPFSQRNIFVGVQGGFGTLRFGRIDTPFRIAGAKADQFDDESIGDIKNLLVGETRANNLIYYTSPKIAEGLSFNVVVQPGEGRVASDDATDTEHGVADSQYASIVWENKMLYLAAAYAGNEPGGVKFDGSTAAIDAWRVVGTVKPTVALELGALYQIAEGTDQDNSTTATLTGGDAKENSWLLSAGYTIEAFKLKAQYGQTKGDETDYKRSELALGFDYKLSKSMTTQFYYVTYEDKDRVVNGITDPKTDSFGVGLIYNF